MYIPLNIKTEYSLLDSLIKVKDLVKYALDNNLKALTITDNNLYGVYEFYLECTKNNIKPIIGLEVEINDLKIILYAKNNEGYKNLIKINKNEKNIELLNKYSNDLICILPYKSMSLYNDLNKIYSDIFVGYKNELEKENISYPNIYMNEILYFNKQDKVYYMYLQGIKKGTTIDEVNIKEDNSFKIEESNEIYKYIYDNCNVKINKRDDLLPKYKVPDGYDSNSYLKEMVRIGLKNKFGEKINKKYIDRIKYELDIINKMGYSNYFLIVMDYVKYAKENNILVGPGRGSAVGSLVSYALDITEIDPLKYDLMFERFLNPARATMPDIDIDFEDNKRYQVINYCVEKYGYDKVSSIITYSSLTSRQVLRDVSKVMDLNQKNIDSFIKLIDKKKLEDNYKNPKIKQLIDNNKELSDLYKISLKLEGLKRQIGVHAAGIVISNKNLDDVLPVIEHNGMNLSCITKDYIESLGLLKMDLLAVSNLNTISKTIEYLKKDNININIKQIPLNDTKTYELFKNGNTNGIFQFESIGIKYFLRRLKPDNINDISNALGMYRPGPMNNIDSFVNRKNGKEKIDYIDSRLESILKPTYGIIVFQEQIMKIANVMANYNLQEADILRYAVSKKKEELIKNEKKKFIEQSINNGYSDEVSLKVFNLILKFAEYGFNMAHSIGYSYVSYEMAYLKANYPKYFLKSLLDNIVGASNLKEYIYEARLNNITILNPDINKSTNNFEIEKEGLRYPLSSIKNIGYNVVNTIIEERNKGKFNDIFDFTSRTYSKIVNKEVIISLIDAGCFDSFGINHKTLIDNIEIIINYADLKKDIDDIEIPVLEEENEYTKKELLDKSFNVFGFYLTNHPIIDIKAKDKEIISIKDIKNYFNKKINIAIIVDRIKTIDTKNNEKMCFLTGSDELDSIDVVMFPEILKQYNVKVGDILKINGRIEKRFDKYQMIANTIEILTNK